MKSPAYMDYEVDYEVSSCWCRRMAFTVVQLMCTSSREARDKPIKCARNAMVTALIATAMKFGYPQSKCANSATSMAYVRLVLTVARCIEASAPDSTVIA